MIKNIYVCGLVLCSIVVFGGISASTALATEVPQLLVEGKTLALGESLALTGEEEAGEAGFALIEDMNASAAGDPDII